jgi:hypothetical protein
MFMRFCIICTWTNPNICYNTNTDDDFNEKRYMSRLVDRYPQAQRLPLPNVPTDDPALLKALEPYLGWTLAEIDTATTDILISDASVAADGKARHLVLLSGRAVSLWLQHQGNGKGRNSAANS